MLFKPKETKMKVSKLNQVKAMLKSNPNLTAKDIVYKLNIKKHYAYNLLCNAKKKPEPATQTPQVSNATQEQHAITVKELLRSAQQRIKELEARNTYLEERAQQLTEGYQQSERELFEQQAKNFDLKAIIKYLEDKNA